MVSYLFLPLPADGSYSYLVYFTDSGLFRLIKAAYFVNLAAKNIELSLGGYTQCNLLC